MKKYSGLIDECNKELKEYEQAPNKVRANRTTLTLLEEKGVFQYRNKEYDNAYTTFNEISQLYQSIRNKINSYYKEELDKWYNLLSEYLNRYPDSREFFSQFFSIEDNLQIWLDWIERRISQKHDPFVFCDLLLELYPDNIELLQKCGLISMYIDDDYSLECWNKILKLESENTEAINKILFINSNHFSKDKSLRLINEKLYIEEIKLDLLVRKIRLLESLNYHVL